MWSRWQREQLSPNKSGIVHETATFTIFYFNTTVVCLTDVQYLPQLQMVLDPTKEEEKNGTGVMAIALMPGTQQVTQWWQEGRFDGQKVAEALELCTDGCGCVHKMMEAKLKASSTRI